MENSVFKNNSTENQFNTVNQQNIEEQFEIEALKSLHKNHNAQINENHSKYLEVKS